MNPITTFLAAALGLIGIGLGWATDPFIDAPVVIGAVLIGLSLKMANTWQKFVILRAGKLQGVKGPGLFWIVPVIDSVVAIIDERIQTTSFNAEANGTSRPASRIVSPAPRIDEGGAA